MKIYLNCKVLHSKCLLIPMLFFTVIKIVLFAHVVDLHTSDIFRHMPPFSNKSSLLAVLGKEISRF